MWLFCREFHLNHLRSPLSPSIRIIPQAILSRWALLVGGKIYWLVWGLIGLLFPLSWPISKLLDFVLGHKSGVYYKRAQLKEFVSYHAASAFEQNEGSSGGEAKVGDIEEGDGSSSSSDSDDGGLPKEERLTNDEVMIIKGALDLTSKNVTTSMTPLEKVFSLDEATVIDARTLQSILDAGHSRIPLWRDDPSNFVGMLLVKSLNLNFILEGGIIARADVKELPLVDAATPLYTMLNIFQTGRSHMAAVLEPGSQHKAVGVITLEDIIEELIQEEIEDEMDLWRREHIRVRKAPSRRQSQDLSQYHRHHHHHHQEGVARSKSGISVRRERRDQRKRTRRGREMALGVESDDPGGVESDFGPTAPSLSDIESPMPPRRDVETDGNGTASAAKREYMSSPSSSSALAPPHRRDSGGSISETSSPAVAHVRDRETSSRRTSLPARPGGDQSEEMVSLDI